ncbi:FAD/NAD(P)-binding domain-containing protein [Aspergillus homomorphus CBS 101889]|uniref:FAD/NAD(P)-binding domain-containing protein n=1 Tax=Aspergillus homomorphus (strain CBS 101889) TaxID=1450537 RepID=A0A395HNQ2_ASPHC|nr:FAD/NAD(P)-binding domain-containing protein [Aspergillus homomorphus CBS 101889]RAL09582.1 FAD/NAD(P)-binding domain-containing protein [Aspergillus homomorphus CBS 101889]
MTVPNDTTTTSKPAAATTLNVAIIGGGIVGLILALGLLRHGIRVTIYEQAHEFHEIGAGVAFTANAQRCMELLDPRILAGMRRVANKNPNEYYQYVDGYHDRSGGEEELLFQIYAGDVGFDGCHRAHFLAELVQLLPPGVVQFRKRLDSYANDGTEGGKVQLQFCDGTTAEADLVVGCDGIKSRVRQKMFGEANPVSQAHYTHKIAYRGLIPMESAVAALGKERAFNQCMHMGPRAHVLNFPVAMHTMMNVVAFVHDPGDWPLEGKMDAPARRDEVVAAFADWGPAVRAMIDLLPDMLTKWAIFDTYDHPAPYYTLGRAVATITAMEGNDPDSVAAVIAVSLQAYSHARLERSQWLVQSSRQVCEVYEWAHAQAGGDPDRCKQEIEWRAHRIWYLDIEQMLQDAKDGYCRQLKDSRGGS